MKESFIIDDRPSEHPEVVARRRKQWANLPESEKNRIDKEIDEFLARNRAEEKK